MWFTCCAFYNVLLNVDGLDKNWEQGVRSDWENCNSLSPCNNYNLQIATSFTISRINFKFALMVDTHQDEDEVNETNLD